MPSEITEISFDTAGQATKIQTKLGEKYLPAQQSTGVLDGLRLQCFGFFVTHIVGRMEIQHVTG